MGSAVKRNGTSVQVVGPRSPDQVMFLQPDALAALDEVAVIRRCQRGQEIYGQEDPADCWYRVVSGLLRRFALRPNGRRQIVDFLLPGDFCGFAGGNEHHYFSVEAVMPDSVVACYPRRRVETLTEADPRVGQLIRQKAFDAIARLQCQVRILGRTRAPEKVGSFLLEMAARRARGPGDRFDLPMSRYDIADYLALSVETVSRALTCLKRRGTIELAGTRQITIVDHDALQDNAGDEMPVPASTGIGSHRGSLARKPKAPGAPRDLRRRARGRPDHCAPEASPMKGPMLARV
jgi:CRP/FNR family transcriptional regulator, nitrogen fixation regulation protein